MTFRDVASRNVSLVPSNISRISSQTSKAKQNLLEEAYASKMKQRALSKMKTTRKSNQPSLSFRETKITDFLGSKTVPSEGMVIELPPEEPFPHNSTPIQTPSVHVLPEKKEQSAQSELDIVIKDEPIKPQKRKQSTKSPNTEKRKKNEIHSVIVPKESLLSKLTQELSPRSKPDSLHSPQRESSFNSDVSDHNPGGNRGFSLASILPKLGKMNEVKEREIIHNRRVDSFVTGWQKFRIEDQTFGVENGFSVLRNTDTDQHQEQTFTGVIITILAQDRSTFMDISLNPNSVTTVAVAAKELSIFVLEGTVRLARNVDTFIDLSRHDHAIVHEGDNFVLANSDQHVKARVRIFN
ncbi:hypothetical protein BLNAU_8443 [Blattamonas nauphoetae]|uniref:Mif2/CENP-C cupin domain-containing protein n=1 Tax=Blattamonas nauphoetae TaxID=2049346 RepID=A0ABQ9XYR0_9EUKA|nr:hypothetical protein BLNAU_8443 [Blattamonas nauphoetae]